MIEYELLRGIEGKEGIHIHQCPPSGSSIMPCCGLDPFEIPGWHRITAKPELVNCDRMGLKVANDLLRDEVARLQGIESPARNLLEYQSPEMHHQRKGSSLCGWCGERWPCYTESLRVAFDPKA